MSDDAAELTPDEVKAMQNAPEGVTSDEIADMIAAVDAVKAGEPTAAPPAPAAKPAPAPKASADPAPNGSTEQAEPELPSFTARIRQLEAEQKAREEARQTEQSSASKILDEARAEGERIKKEAAEYARQQREEFNSRFRQRPLDALKEAGIAPDQLVNEVVKEGSPEWQLLKAQEREIQALKSKLGTVDEFKAQLEREAEQRRQYEQWQHTQRVQQEFVQKANAEQAPGLHALAEQAHKLLGPFMPHMRSPDDWKIILGDHAAAQYQQMSGKPVASLDEIVQHLNYLASQQSLDTASQPSQGAAGQPRAGRSGAGQSRAQGPRTLSAATAGERRSAPKPPSQMSDDELNAAMIAAAEESMRSAR